jgi:hypothetical protein
MGLPPAYLILSATASQTSFWGKVAGQALAAAQTLNPSVRGSIPRRPTSLIHVGGRPHRTSRRSELVQRLRHRTEDIYGRGMPRS